MTTDTGAPANLDRRHLILGGVLLGAGGIAMSRQPRPVAPHVGKAELESIIPKKIGDWRYQSDSGLVLPPADELSDSLYQGLVTRSYAAPGGSSIMLLVAYSNKQDGVLQVHRPEVCYPAGGYQLSQTKPIEIANGVGGHIVANSFSATGVSRTEQILYWTRIGSRFPVHWSEQRMAVVRANIQGIIPDGILVRVSSLDSAMDQALPDLMGFAAALIRACGAEGRRLLSGVG